MSRLLIILVGLAILGYPTLLWFVAQASRMPANVGDGDLAPCPDSPNCVSSQDTSDEHVVDPIAYEGTQAQAQERLMTILRDLPRMTVITERDGYVHVETRTAGMRFVDDNEFVFDDENKLIHVRAAARLGYSDVGNNRERIEQIREAL